MDGGDRSMRIALLNPNTNQDVTAAMARIAGAAVPSLSIEGHTAPFGAETITTPDALAVGADAVRDMAARLPGDIQGVIVAAYGDPGLDDLRAAWPGPVCGIGEASFLEAAAHGRSFAVATTTPDLAEAIAARVAAAGLTDRFLGVHLTEGEPLALMRDPDRLLARLAEAVAAAAASGAGAVIIGGGPLASAAQILRPRLSVPIIEPLPAAARLIARLIADRIADRTAG
jgi:allantoin racemase